MMVSEKFMDHKVNGLERWDIFRNDVGTTHLRKVPQVNETKKIVEKLFSHVYKPQVLKESETQAKTYYTWKEMFTFYTDLINEKVLKDPTFIKNFLK
eukprot:Pgem_evm1s19629